MLIEGYLSKKGRTLAFVTSFTKNILANVSIDFLSKRRLSYIVSGVVLIGSLFSLFTLGLQQGVDFVGGRSYQVRFVDAVNPSEIASDLNDVFGSGTNVKTFGEANQIKVTTPYKVDVEGIEVDQEIQQKLYDALLPYLPDGISLDDFVVGSSEKSIGILQSVKVGPTIADDIKKNAVWAQTLLFS